MLLLRRVLLGCTFLALAAAASAQATPDAAAPIPFADAHVHLNDPGMQLALMRRFGATHAVVFWGGRSTNESVAAAAAANPGVLIPFASISPERTAYRPHWKGDAQPLLAQLEALLASGAYKGIGEISAVHFSSAGFAETEYELDGPMMRGIMELARRFRVPVMVHVEYTRLAQLSALLQAHADVPVIWAHGGYTHAFIAQRMLERHPNLYYELSARTWPAHPRSEDYTLLRQDGSVWPQWLALVEKMPQRFLVGTDASHRSLASEEMKFASVQAFLRQLSPRAQAAVARENLLRLVGVR